MNLFASRPFLQSIASAYYPSHQWTVEDHTVGGRIFRLLRIAGRAPMTRHPFLDMHEPVAAPASDTSTSGVKWLPNVSHELVSVETFRSGAGLTGFSAAPTVLWRDFATWNEYLELLRRRQLLRDDQRRRRRLEEIAGPLTFTVDDASPDVLPTTFTWKSTQWRRLTAIDLFAHSPNRDFFHQLRAHGLLRASTLRAGGRLLATWLGAVFERRWYGWIFAFNPDPVLSKYSVGRQLLYSMLEESHRAGHREFDFSNGCEPYKLFFATHVRLIGPLGTPPVRYRVERLLRERLRNSPQVYHKMKAVRLVVQREMFRARCSLSRMRGGNWEPAT